MSTGEIGLALSGGGVKGFAHLGLLKILDELDIKPSYISGTSMGAIIGALYARGLKAQEIEDRVREHIIPEGSKVTQIYKNRKNLLKWSKLFSFEKQTGGFFAADGVFEHLFSELIDLNFEDLKIPFCSIATNFHSGKELALTHGELLSAVKASMAVPGVFAPVSINDTLLVDGGLVNNLPVNHIHHCKFRIASNVISLPKKESQNVKNLLIGSLDIMTLNATHSLLEQYPCDVLSEVETNDINIFDFLKIEQSLIAGEKAAEKARLKLQEFLSLGTL